LSTNFGLKVLDYFTARTLILKNRWPNIKKFHNKTGEEVKIIIDEVKTRGDAALIDYSKRFEGVELSVDQIRVSGEDIKRAYRKISKKQISAIKFVKRRVEKLQKRILQKIVFHYESEGIKIRGYVSPIRRLGCYVPGGSAVYPSSLIMTVIPAKVAGVPEVVVCSPIQKEGEIDPMILVTADICRVDEIYRVGGAQAIAAMAYGTETIKPVDKIVGPGNRFVMTAKILVSKDLPIDAPAGPSEIVVLADESADARIIALDLISQAEHLDGVAVLVTTSKKILDSVIEELWKTVKNVSNYELVFQNLVKNGCIIICKDLEEAVRFINEFAPEHLEILTADGWKVAEQIMSAGLILIGDYTPVAASDYCFGTLHILPTEGYCHVYSGLSVLDFVKRFNIVECSKEGLNKVREPLKTMAETEKLLNHSWAVEGRFKK